MHGICWFAVTWFVVLKTNRTRLIETISNDFYFALFPEQISLERPYFHWQVKVGRSSSTVGSSISKIIRIVRAHIGGAVDLGENCAKAKRWQSKSGIWTWWVRMLRTIMDQRRALYRRRNEEKDRNYLIDEWIHMKYEVLSSHATQYMCHS